MSHGNNTILLIFLICTLNETNGESRVENLNTSLMTIHNNIQDASLFNLKYLDDKRIKCNDGTNAGYYYRRSKHQSNEQLWMIYLEGGWYCHDSESCRSRSQNNQFLISSRWWPFKRNINGILSQNETINPNYHDYNQIYIPYCSSDLWTGNNEKNRNEFHFHGHRIIRSVIGELLNFEPFRNLRKLILTGTSAGGIGVLMNVDQVSYLIKRNLRNPEIIISGLVESAWYLEKKPFADESSDFFTMCGSNCDLDKAMNSALKIWRPFIPRKCLLLMKDQVWKCYYGKYLIPMLRTKVFVIQSLFDEVQLQLINAPIIFGGSREKLAYIQQTGHDVKESLEELEGVFATSCTDHEILLNNDWIKLEIRGYSLQTTLKNWDLALPKLNFLSKRKNNQRKRRVSSSDNRETLEFFSKLISIMNHRMFIGEQNIRWRHRRDLKIIKENLKMYHLIDDCNGDRVTSNNNHKSHKKCFIPLFPKCSNTCLDPSMNFFQMKLKPLDIYGLFNTNVTQLARMRHTTLDQLKSLTNKEQLDAIFCT